MLRGNTDNILADNWYQLEINHIDYEQQYIIHEESSLVYIFLINSTISKKNPAHYALHCIAQSQ